MASRTNFVPSEVKSKPEDSNIKDKKPRNQEKDEIVPKTHKGTFGAKARPWSKKCFDLLTRKHVVAHNRAEKLLHKFLRLYRLSMHICIILASEEYCGIHFKPAILHFDKICSSIAKAANRIFQEVVAPKNFIPSDNFARFHEQLDTWECEYQTLNDQLLTPPSQKFLGRDVNCVNYADVIKRARERTIRWSNWSIFGDNRVTKSHTALPLFSTTKLTQ